MVATSQFTISVINDGQDGAPGGTGPQGVSVLNVYPQYRLSNSSTELTGSGTGYTWSDTKPEVNSGQYLWTRQRNELSDGSTRYSNATCDVTISGVVLDVDQNKQAITSKVWESDISTAIDEYNNETVSTIADRVTQTETDIGGINTTISSIQTTVSNKADSSTVSTMQTQVNNISDTVSGHTQSISNITTRLDDDEEILETTETLASQTADKFTWLVSSGTSSSNFTLTSRVAELVSPQVVIKDPAGSATIITGGKIAANSITTAMLAADAIKSTNYEPSQYENSPYSESGTYLNLTTGNIITPNFGLDAVNSTAYIDGSISARKLYLGMYPSYLSEDDGTLTSVNGALVTIETQSNNYMMFDGEILIINTDNFSIDEDGDVSMTGSITATSGYFGGWQIYDNSTHYGSNIHYGSSIGSANSVFMIPAGSISSHVIGGSSAISGWVFTVGQNFGVTSSGSLYANGATITGNVTITGGEMGGLTVDTDSIYMSDTGISSNSSYYAIWAGETNGENGSSLTDAPFKVNHSGAMYAASGEIGGWQINNTSIIKNYTYDSKTGYTYMNSNPYTSGNTVPWNPMFGVYYDGAWQFYVRSNGELYSNNIKAIQGTLGSWTLSSTSIMATGNSKTTGIQVPSNGTWSFAAGATNANDWSTAPFRVNHNGAMYSTSGQIGSWNISANYLSYGTIAAANSIYLIPAGSTSSYTIGGSSAISGWVITAGANFGVTKTGVLYAKDAILSGKITSTDGTIGGFTIGTNYIRGYNNTFTIYSDTNSAAIVLSGGSTSGSSLASTHYQCYSGSKSVDISPNGVVLGDTTLEIYNVSDGGSLETITGTVDNGIIVTNTNVKSGRFIINGSNDLGIYDNDRSEWVLFRNGTKTWLCGNGYAVRMGEGNSSNLITFMPRTASDGVSNGKVNLGAASCRWQKVYTTSGVDTSSDERIKTIHRYLDEDHKKLFMALKPIEYSFIDKPDEKHFGLGAQTTEAAMEKYGFGPEYSLVEHAFYDEEDTYGRYDTYNMNYDEVAMLAVPVVQEHEKEIAMLKVRINELETRLSQLTH